MLIDIDKIVVGDRIRKDFGDIQELADNIKKNGLLNPLTVNGDYKLLAGERRLKACKLLGWSQVDVRMVESEDEAQDIEIELSENNVRRNFTGSELAEGIRRQMAIESEKARERQEASRFGSDGGANICTATGKSRDKAAEAFGISGEQARKTLYVADNADLLDPSDFADWDEGKLSTNKAYQRIKAAQKQAERERDAAKQELDAIQQDLADAWQAQEDAETEAVMLKRKLESIERPKPEVVEREVVPEDYEATKRKVDSLKRDNSVYVDTNRKLRKQLEDARRELDKAKDMLGMDKTLQDVRQDAQYLVAATNNYVRRYGGLTWTAASFSQVDSDTIEDLRTAAINLATFANALVASLEELDA